jgi:XTP/dITP diphosphohydrolase
VTVRPAVVVVSPRLGPVLPAAAVPLLRTGAAVRGDADLPPELRHAFAAEPSGDDPDGLLLTVDAATGSAASWLAAGADLLHTPEPAGAALLDAVAVMDRLRSPGGCPWDAEQTHASLMPYLIEETYELYQALEDGDRAALREELGDVLLQVLFHSRVASEDGDDTGDAFDVDAVAAELVTKLIARHPHVFAGSEQVATAADQELRWDELKRTEKRRESSIEGVALAQPAAALAAKLVSRTGKAGLPADLLPAGGGGAALFSVVAALKDAGEDPESALRSAARRFADDVQTAERSARSAGLDPAALTAEQWRAHWPSAP